MNTQNISCCTMQTMRLGRRCGSDAAVVLVVVALLGTHHLCNASSATSGMHASLSLLTIPHHRPHISNIRYSYTLLHYK